MRDKECGSKASSAASPRWLGALRGEPVLCWLEGRSLGWVQALTGWQGTGSKGWHARACLG